MLTFTVFPVSCDSLEPHGIFGSNYSFLHCQATGMQNGGEALLGFILACRCPL